MKVLYVGAGTGTSLHRSRALRRIGHDVTSVDPYLALGQTWFARAWAFRTGGLWISRCIESYVLKAASGKKFDVAFVDNGDLVSPALVMQLKAQARTVINYNQDNPYVPRDGSRWRLFLQALPFYDLAVTPRRSSVANAYNAGARRVLEVRFAADETVHVPPLLSEEDQKRFSADVVFVGTWMPERGPFLKRLTELGVPLRIYGPRWDRAPEYQYLKDSVTGCNLDDVSYVRAIAGAKIALGLLSKGNEDLHTTRSLEIPAIGTLLCAERTSDHLTMYREGHEALFWSNAAECAEICTKLLKVPSSITRIAAAGRRRVLANGDFNEHLLTRIIAEATSSLVPSVTRNASR